MGDSVGTVAAAAAAAAVVVVVLLLQALFSFLRVVVLESPLPSLVHQASIPMFPWRIQQPLVHPEIPADQSVLSWGRLLRLSSGRLQEEWGEIN